MRAIRTSKHTLSHANTHKLSQLQNFIQEYRNAIQHYINYLWNTPVHYNNKTFDRSKNQLECPSFLDYNLITFETKLSARALCSASTQACGMIKAATEKRRKQLFKLKQLKQENKSYKKLEEKINKFPLVKPTVPENFRMELSSKCCLLEQPTEASHFEHWIRLRSLGNYFKDIIIPIKTTKHSNRFLKSGFKLLGSFLVYKDNIDIRWEKHVERKKTGEVIGCDPGITDMLTFSNHLSVLCKHPHGHTYNSILDRMKRKKRGSTGFRKAADLRTNYVNWHIKQLNFNGIKSIKLEDNSHLHSIYAGRKLAHNSWSLIKQKMMGLCELAGVQLVFNSCIYRSQRCNCCGWVQKNNRKGKEFFCLSCGYYDDADHNSSLNQLVDLPFITLEMKKKNLNRVGFFWLEMGFKFLGQESGVPVAQEG